LELWSVSKKKYLDVQYKFMNDKSNSESSFEPELYALQHLRQNPLRGAVTPEEAETLFRLVLDRECLKCLEIGVANGGSALALAQAVKKIGGTLDGIDPCQLNEHNSAGIELLRRFSLDDVFTLHPQPTHLAAPKLLEAEIVFDLVFIDGMHSFEFKALDAFYADRLLRKGGLLVMHDAGFSSTKKVHRMIETTGRFKIVETPLLHLGLAKKLRRILGALSKRKSYPFRWPNGGANMLVLEKISNKEVAWDFFKNF
jgi:predicted O-methyltransferase YrrM